MILMGVQLKTKRTVRALISISLLTICLLPFQNCAKFKASDLSLESSSFTQVNKIIADNCLSCHTANSPQGSLALNTSAAFASSGWVIPQNPGSSKLITRLKNYPTKDGTQNMPPGSGTLSDEDYQTLYSWIQNMAINTGSLNCQPNESIQDPKLKRLTSQQFRNSMTSAFGSIFTSSQFPNFRDDNPRIGLQDNPNLLEINEVNFTSLYEASDSLADSIVANVSAWQNCISQSVGVTCFTNLINQYGRALWRRPVTSQELTSITEGLSDVSAAGISRSVQGDYVLKALILSPNHLFRTEVGQGTPQGIFQLTHHEVASLLSFAAWDSPPDATLQALADQGRLHDVSVLRQQVARLTADPRFNSKLTTFIIDLLKIEDIMTIQKDASFAITSTERQALYTSAQMSINQSYSAPSSDLFSPFRMNSFQLNSQTNRFISGPGSTQFASTSLNANERFGVLSHPAFLTSMAGQISTGIVRRGVFTLEQLLCEHLPPAPADVTSNPDLPPGFNPDTASSRQLLTITHSARTDCMGCHVKIDPAGFAFESFDTFGRFRTFERTNIPIDSSGILAGIDTSPITFNNSVDFLAEVEQSPRFKSCITKKFFEYSTGFNGEGRAVQCELDQFERGLRAKPETTTSLLESIVELPSFTRRRPASAR